MIDMYREFEEILSNKIKCLEDDKKIYQQQFTIAIDNLNSVNIEKYSNLLSQTMYGLDLLKGIQYKMIERKFGVNEKDTKENNI